ncbi:hypothetical protein [Mycobacterium genavense]|uniref:Rv3852 family protein n=1 Tax=Mycobacterium genavense TaxID=36812 RepID=UPI000472D1C6|nr:hypothetical protein [Mycobacterium genavense]
MADPQDQPDREANGAATPPAKTPPAKAAQKAPAKKAPAKKAPAKAPAGSPAPTPPKPPQPPNGEIAAAAKDAAAQAKSTVDGANNPVSANIPQSAPAQSYVPVVVAVALSLLAILLIRQLRRR